MLLEVLLCLFPSGVTLVDVGGPVYRR